MKKYICKYCNNEFEVDDAQARAREKKSQIKYCSKKCSALASRKGEYIKCKHCKKLFYTTRNKFCSIECVNNYYHRRITKNKYIYDKNNPLVKKFNCMYKRCYDKNDINYKNYGARNVKICEEWLYDRDKFVEWGMENGYKKGLEIDRIDVNGDYTPNNCRFVTKLQNVRNRRITIKYLYNGKEMTLKEIADLNGIKYKTLWQRINRDKLSIERALGKKNNIYPDLTLKLVR